MKVIKLSKKTSILEAAQIANLIPETVEIGWKTEKGVILEGQSAGNYRQTKVEIIFAEKENGNGGIKINNDVGAGG